MRRKLFGYAKTAQAYRFMLQNGLCLGSCSLIFVFCSSHTWFGIRLRNFCLCSFRYFCFFLNRFLRLQGFRFCLFTFLFHGRYRFFCLNFCWVIRRLVTIFRFFRFRNSVCCRRLRLVILLNDLYIRNHPVSGHDLHVFRPRAGFTGCVIF